MLAIKMMKMKRRRNQRFRSHEKRSTWEWDNEGVLSRQVVDYVSLMIIITSVYAPASVAQIILLLILFFFLSPWNKSTTTWTSFLPSLYPLFNLSNSSWCFSPCSHPKVATKKCDEVYLEWWLITCPGKLGEIKRMLKWEVLGIGLRKNGIGLWGHKKDKTISSSSRFSRTWITLGKSGPQEEVLLKKWPSISLSLSPFPPSSFNHTHTRILPFCLFSPPVFQSFIFFSSS